MKAFIIFCITILSFLIPCRSYAQVSVDTPEGMVFVKGGSYQPLYSIDTNIATTGPFYIDKFPVTNYEYYKFVEENPQYRRGNVKDIFADKGYLRHWPVSVSNKEDLLKIIDKPVVNVSWFMAKKYCESRGKRLPTVDEWEFAALASEDEAFGANNPSYYQNILDWYSKSSAKGLGSVGSTFKNFYGIYDMLGLVWEWVLDFNTALISGESRKDGSLDKNLFCGGGAASATDMSNYAAFMRYAFRGSLKANYTIGNLGFRCAKSLNDE